MTELTVRLQPRASKTQVVGERDGRVVVRVTAPPVDGKANAALEAYVAERTGLPKSAVSVVRGHTSRDEVVRVEGVTGRELRAALGIAPPRPTA